MIAEFKIRVPLALFKDTPVIARFEYDTTESHDDAAEQATDRAAEIADAVEREVRWNWQGSHQGHYVGSGYSYRCRVVCL